MNKAYKILTVLALSGTTVTLSAQQEVKPREVKAVKNPAQRSSSKTAVYQPMTKGAGLVQQEQVYITVDKAAEYPGGYQAIDTYFKGNTDAAINASPAPTYVSFTVEKDGSVSDAVMVKSQLTASRQAKALRKVSSMTGWKPALINNQPVRSRVTIPLPVSR